MSSRPANSRLIRILGWAAYGVLLALAVALRSADVSAVVRVRLIDGLLYLLPIALTMVGALLLSARTDRVERRLWFLIAAISLLILWSEVYFTWYSTTIDLRGPDMPAPFQTLQLLAVVLGVWVVATMTTFGSAPARSILRYAFDVFAGMILLAPACYWFFVLPMIQTVPGATWQSAAISALYPVVGLTIVFFMGVAMLAGRTYRWRSWERLMCAAFLLYGLGLMVSPVSYVQMKISPDPRGSFWIVAVLGFGYYVLFMAIVYRFTTQHGDIALEPWFFPRLGPRWLPMFYPILIGVGLPVLGVAALRIGEDPDGIPITIAAVALAAVLVVRSWLRSSETVLHRGLATTDSVSGAFNYRYLRKRLASDLVYAKAAGAELAVITIGVEGLKSISDATGSAEVNCVLAAVAAAIREEVDGDTTLSRSGGDVFVLIARRLSAEDALELARRLLDAAVRGMEKLAVRPGFSAGIAVFPADGDLVDELIARSGSAQAVSASKEDLGVVVYDDDLAADPGPASRLAAARTRSRRVTTRVLGLAVEARDPDTRRHSQNVADLASALALVLNLPAERAHVLELAAQMHDVGMIGVPDSVLRASGVLDREQRELAEQHTIVGERILASARLDEVLPAVRHHHERWDGTGYPDGLSGRDIPLEARILAVCDAYESMTTLHSYDQSLSVEEAIAEIGRCMGTQFDPDIAAPFCRMIQQIHGASPRDHAGRTGDLPQQTGSVPGARA